MTNNPGGVEAYVMNLVRHLDHEKIRIDFLVNYEGHIAYEEEIKSWGSKIIYLVGRRKHPWKHYCDYRKFFRQHGRAYDGIYCNVLALTNMDDIRFAYKAGIPVIGVHAHNSSAPAGGPFSLIERLHYTHQKMVKSYADNLFACSEQAGQWMFGESADFKVIHNAIDLKKFCYDEEKRNAARKKKNISPETMVLGTVGRLEEQKNPLFLPEVFQRIRERCPNCIFVHVGDGSLRGEMEKKVKELQLEGSYYLEGTCRDTSEYYQMMDVFLLPSLYEGLSISIVEAQTCDLPCIVSEALSEESSLVSERYKALPLDMGAEKWADTILHFVQGGEKTRKDRSEIIRAAGYDIEEECRWMEELLYNGKKAGASD